MLYKIQPLVKITIHWKGEDEKWNAFRKWQQENEIYPAARGGYSGLDSCAWLYDSEDAIKIEQYLKEVAKGRKCQILRS